MLLPEILEKPTNPAVSLEEARKHLDVHGFDDDDAQIATLVEVATGHLESTLNLTLAKTKFRQSFSDFCHAATPDIYPISSIISISYFDESNNKVDLPVDNYQLFNTIRGSVIHFLKSPSCLYPRPDAVQVTFWGGYEDGEIPDPLKAAILMHTASLYDFRSDLSVARPISTKAWKTLVWPYRRPYL